MKRFLLHCIYNFLFLPVFLILLPFYLGRMLRRGDWEAGFFQRLGFYPKVLRKKLKKEAKAGLPPRPWIQAVSVGEMFIALKLIAALQKRDPKTRVLLSTTTTTGFALAKRQAVGETEVIYTPIDFWPCVNRAWRSLNPGDLWVIEGGLWPNMVTLAKHSGHSVVLTNARLSPRSEKRFKKFAALAKHLLFKPLDLVLATDQEDVARLKSIGVDEKQIAVVGNIKFDNQEKFVEEAQVEKLRQVAKNYGIELDPHRPVLLGGSTHPGEEQWLAKQYLKLKAQLPDLLLMIAPRHVERAAEVEAELQALGLEVTRRSDPKPGKDVLLIDTTGELKAWYMLATLVFVGKSLQPSAPGGQNPVEVVLAGKPVLFGPYMQNFQVIVEQLLKAEAAVQVSADGEEFVTQVTRLITDAKERERLVEKSKSVLAFHYGAAERTVDRLHSVGHFNPK